jgi:hypothetical protein
MNLDFLLFLQIMLNFKPFINFMFIWIYLIIFTVWKISLTGGGGLEKLLDLPKAPGYTGHSTFSPILLP